MNTKTWHAVAVSFLHSFFLSFSVVCWKFIDQDPNKRWYLHLGTLRKWIWRATASRCDRLLYYRGSRRSPPSRSVCSYSRTYSDPVCSSTRRDIQRLYLITKNKIIKKSIKNWKHLMFLSNLSVDLYKRRGLRLPTLNRIRGNIKYRQIHTYSTQSYINFSIVIIIIMIHSLQLILRNYM